MKKAEDWLEHGDLLAFKDEDKVVENNAIIKPLDDVFDEQIKFNQKRFEKLQNLGKNL